MKPPGTDTPAGNLDLSAHPGVARVLEALRAHRVETTVRHLPDAVRTAKQAADALGIAPDEIANSLVFAATDTHRHVTPLLVMSSGGRRIDPDKVADLLELDSLTMATPEQVRTWTGFVIGGVAPVGFPAPIPTVVDVSLSRFPVVWAAAGHPHSVFSTAYDELLRITGGHPLEVI